jgi:hypothetical protein
MLGRGSHARASRIESDALLYGVVFSFLVCHTCICFRAIILLLVDLKQILLLVETFH